MSACGVYVHRDGDFSILGTTVREERTPLTSVGRCRLGCHHPHTTVRIGLS